MKNIEKYYIEIMNQLKSSNCHEDTINMVKWLNEEAKEFIKLTSHEKCILESIDKKYKWIARDKSNILFIYKEIPKKCVNEWCFSEGRSLEIFNDILKFIKWEDEEPYLIKDILNNCEVIERYCEVCKDD